MRGNARKKQCAILEEVPFDEYRGRFIAHGNVRRSAPNKSFKPLAKLARTPSTPRLFAHGFAIVAQTALRTGRRLTGRYA